MHSTILLALDAQTVIRCRRVCHRAQSAYVLCTESLNCIQFGRSILHWIKLAPTLKLSCTALSAFTCTESVPPKHFTFTHHHLYIRCVWSGGSWSRGLKLNISFTLFGLVLLNLSASSDALVSRLWNDKWTKVYVFKTALSDWNRFGI